MSKKGIIYYLESSASQNYGAAHGYGNRLTDETFKKYRGKSKKRRLKCGQL
jgi:hypothetical protein